MCKDCRESCCCIILFKILKHWASNSVILLLTIATFIHVNLLVRLVLIDGRWPRRYCQNRCMRCVENSFSCLRLKMYLLSSQFTKIHLPRLYLGFFTVRYFTFLPLWILTQGPFLTNAYVYWSQTCVIFKAFTYELFPTLIHNYTWPNASFILITTKISIFTSKGNFL